MTMAELIVVDNTKRNDRVPTKVIYPGDLIVDFAGRIYRFERGIRPNAKFSSGKIVVTDLEYPDYPIERYTDNFALAVLTREGDSWVE